jgi:hypothetical protein
MHVYILILCMFIGFLYNKNFENTRFCCYERSITDLKKYFEISGCQRVYGIERVNYLRVQPSHDTR